MIRIMGVDAGFTSMGLVCIDIDARIVLGAQTIRTEKNSRKRGVRVADDDAERCQALARGFHDFYVRYLPHLVAVELPTGGAQGARANRAMGMATGIVAACIALNASPVEWIAPGEGKRAATHRRSATKAEVEAAVLDAFSWPTKWLDQPAAVREHQADAAAAVLAAMNGALVKAVRTALSSQKAG